MSGKHSKLSPSFSTIWFNCSAAPKFIDSLNLPPEPPSAYADEGTQAHVVFATALALENPFSVRYSTPEQKQYLPIAIDYVETIKNLHPTVDVHREIKVDPSRYVGTSHCSGTADVIIPVDFGPLYVADLKFGVHVAVDVEDNTQLLLYALGALAKFENEGYTFTEIVMAILQPRAYHPDGPIREWRISYDEIIEWGKIFKKKAKETLSDNPVFTPDPEKQCRFCPAQGVCRALAKHELKVARTVFTEVIDDHVDYKDIEVLTVKELSFILRELPGLRRWMSNVSDYALQLLKSGKEMPYYDIKDSLSNRKWDASEDELEMYFDPEVLYEKKLRTPPQVEKLVGKGSVDNLVMREVTGHTLVRTNDPKESHESEVANIFTEVDKDGEEISI